MFTKTILTVFNVETVLSKSIISLFLISTCRDKYAIISHLLSFNKLAFSRSKSLFFSNSVHLLVTLNKLFDYITFRVGPIW